jgi:glycosyltransferase involved in cell wall biosynthesis
MAILTVAVDVRIRSGLSGGLESVVIGLARGLSGLEGDDERYVFVCDDAATAWLEPYIGGRSEILAAPARAGRASGALGSLKARVNRVSSLPLTIWGRRPVTPRELANTPPPSDGTVERLGADVVHFTTQGGFRTQIPSIYHPHDLQHLHLPQFFSARDRRLRERRYRVLAEQAALVVVTSEWTRRDVIDHYGLAPDKVRVIPWAPPTAAYATPSAEDVAAVHARFRLPDRFVFYPAQTWPHKNHVALLRAIARIRDTDGIIVPAVFSGFRDGHAREIDAVVDRLGLSEQVTWLGFVSAVDLQALYRLCVAVVIPTRFEAASAPLWEAFLAGAPTAVSTVTSLPDQAGDAALLFEPDDIEAIASAVLRLWTDDGLRAQLVERGRVNVARFSWDRTARLFRAEYRRLGGAALSDEDRLLLTATSPI